MLEGEGLMGAREDHEELDAIFARWHGKKMTAQQFRQQLERIEGRIREYEQRVQNDPGDDYARQKLQSLYMLKATVKGLKKAVVEK